MKSINEILAEIRPEFMFDGVEDFFTAGMLDSFDIVVLVAALDQQFNISIEGTDIVPENFNNIKAIAAMLHKYGVKL